MKITLPMTLALAMQVAEARYHAGGRLVVAPRQYQYNRGDWSQLMHHLLRDPAHIHAHDMWHHSEVDHEWSGPHYVVSHDKEPGVISLFMEMPGVQTKDLEVTLENNTHLRIRGSRRSIAGNDRIIEFDQDFQLDENVDPDSLSVTLQNGILEVKALKKVKQVKHLKIQTISDDSLLETAQVGVEKDLNDVPDDQDQTD